MSDKYKAAELPPDASTALKMAEEREAWATEARDRDQPGSAREFMLTAMLLRYLAETRRPMTEDILFSCTIAFVGSFLIAVYLV